MRYPASEKAEIIRLVEASHVPARHTLATLGIPRATFYRWYDRYRAGGIEALADHRSRPDRVWNRIPETIRAEIVELALRETELSARAGGALHRPKSYLRWPGAGHYITA
jgi:transposase-like protein